MGRTNPTFRDLLRRYRRDWQPFRRGLRAEHKPAFDALFADAEAHADAAGHQNAREPMHPILVAMVLAQKRQLRALSERVEALEAEVGEGDAAASPPAEGEAAERTDGPVPRAGSGDAV